MKSYALIFLSLLLLALEVGATNPLGAASKLSLARKGRFAANSATVDSGKDGFQAFISVDDSLTVSLLRRLGIKVNAVFDGFVIADIPAAKLPELGALPGVRHVSLARQLQLCNDTARVLSNVNPLHAADGRIVPLTGKGVIVGVIDSGVDFNHINLCDNSGRTRVRAVYMPNDSTGIAPVIKGDTLPGSCYETPEQILALTTDYAASSHGTHTTGTAAGSYFANGLHGVAPEADIVICGIPSQTLTDVNLANAVLYIFDYADRVGKPCVINMSIGSNDGPNDGTSFLCKTFEALTGPGRLCVVAAGNDGNAPICFHAAIQGANDTVTTLIRNQCGGLQRDGGVSMWSDGPQYHSSRLVVINRSTGALEYASPFFCTLPDDSVYRFSSETDLELAKYYEGEVLFASAMEPGYEPDGTLSSLGRFHSLWVYDVTSIEPGHLLGLQYIADEHVSLSGWCTKNAYFYTFGLDGMTGGSPVGSISDMATTDSVISVGAYCSRSSYVDRTGATVNIANCEPGDIAYFSSYGPDERGVTRPDICAPGMALLSSGSRYDTVSNQAAWPSPVTIDGMEYPYYSNVGTSMSAPIVTGVIALMLQVNGSLGPEAVRDVLKRTALVDSNVLAGDSERWGSGKIDAVAAVEDVISKSFIPGDVNNDREVNIADVMALIDIILTDGRNLGAPMLLRADVNHDSEILLADVNCVIDLILNNL